MESVDVLLGTYRPAPDFLRAQLDSIWAQVGVGVRVLQREDERGEGAAANFSALLKLSTADYVAFADQDDVWRKGKLERSMACMRRLESQHGAQIPIAVFVDGFVTDAALRPFCGTVISRQKVSVKVGVSFSRLLMQNFIPGNALLVNAALREKAGEIPPEALMHDSWLALVAAAFGHIGFVDEPLYFYRQHQKNVLGATSVGCRHFLSRAMEGRSAFRKRLLANVRQARAFVDRFGGESPASAVALAQLEERSFFARRADILRYRLYKHGLLRNLALFAFA